MRIFVKEDGTQMSAVSSRLSVCTAPVCLDCLSNFSHSSHPKSELQHQSAVHIVLTGFLLPCRCTTGSATRSASTGLPWRSCLTTASAPQRSGKAWCASTCRRASPERSSCEHLVPFSPEELKQNWPWSQNHSYCGGAPCGFTCGSFCLP